MMSTLMPRSSNNGVIASTIAVLPDPTGPPMPMRVIFFKWALTFRDGCMTHGLRVIVDMRMDWTFGAPEKPARFVRREVWNDVRARHEFVADIFEAVRVHHRRHHFAIHGERNEHACTFDECGPMLIAECMAELD